MSTAATLQASPASALPSDHTDDVFEAAPVVRCYSILCSAIVALDRFDALAVSTRARATCFALDATVSSLSLPFLARALLSPYFAFGWISLLGILSRARQWRRRVQRRALSLGCRRRIPVLVCAHVCWLIA